MICLADRYYDRDNLLLSAQNQRGKVCWEDYFIAMSIQRSEVIESSWKRRLSITVSKCHIQVKSEIVSIYEP